MFLVHKPNFVHYITLVMCAEQSNENSVHNLPDLSVSEISAALKLTVENTFQRVRVRGEVSGFKRAPSGHLYMTLKDNDAVLDAVCWRGTASRLRVLPEDGIEVVATGRLTTYAGRSKYQIVAESFEVAGEGALLKLIEARRRQLTAEGLFDPERKRQLPFLPEVIGVVTSPTGAVIRDILHRLEDRFPRRVLIWPVLVQGDGSADQIAEAIDGFNAFGEHANLPRPDVIIVARGGGSIEDLWAFNEEITVRAASRSVIPLISAVGHETDTTLIDFAADIRAPTPTAAAEMAVPVRHELHAQVMDDASRLTIAIKRRLEDCRLRLEILSRGLPNPRQIMEEKSQRLDDWDERLRNSLLVGLSHLRQQLQAIKDRLRKPDQLLQSANEQLSNEGQRLERAIKLCFKDHEQNLDKTASLLESFSYERILERGFSLISGADGKHLASLKDVHPGDNVGLRFFDGEAQARILGKSDSASSRRPASGGSKKRVKSRENDQGKLL